MQPAGISVPIARAAATRRPSRIPKRLRDKDKEVHEGRRELPPANVAEFKK
jgi:hypothetical protein